MKRLYWCDGIYYNQSLTVTISFAQKDHITAGVKAGGVGVGGGGGAGGGGGRRSKCRVKKGGYCRNVHIENIDALSRVSPKAPKPAYKR